MSALDELRNIDTETITPLQAAVVYLSGWHEGDAMLAAEELARYQAIEEAAKLFLSAWKEATNNGKDIGEDEEQTLYDIFCKLSMLNFSDLAAALERKP